jgi:hypothetical protein
MADASCGAITELLLLALLQTVCYQMTIMHLQANASPPHLPAQCAHDAACGAISELLLLALLQSCVLLHTLCCCKPS